MRRHFRTGVLALLAVLLALAPAALAAEIEGKVRSVNMATRTVTLEDGTQLKVQDAAQLQGLKPGASVKASFEQRGDEKVATSIQVQR